VLAELAEPTGKAHRRRTAPRTHACPFRSIDERDRTTDPCFVAGLYLDDAVEHERAEWRSGKWCSWSRRFGRRFRDHAKKIEASYTSVVDRQAE
jgi:hypothetical protein